MLIQSYVEDFFQKICLYTKKAVCIKVESVKFWRAPFKLQFLDDSSSKGLGHVNIINEMRFHLIMLAIHKFPCN